MGAGSQGLGLSLTATGCVLLAWVWRPQAGAASPAAGLPFRSHSRKGWTEVWELLKRFVCKGRLETKTFHWLVHPLHGWAEPVWSPEPAMSQWQLWETFSCAGWKGIVTIVKMLYTYYTKFVRIYLKIQSTINKFDLTLVEQSNYKTHILLHWSQTLTKLHRIWGNEVNLLCKNNLNIYFSFYWDRKTPPITDLLPKWLQKLRLSHVEASSPEPSLGLQCRAGGRNLK